MEFLDITYDLSLTSSQFPTFHGYKVYIKSTMLVDACQILFIFSHFLNNFKELFPTCQNDTLYKGISYSVQ